MASKSPPDLPSPREWRIVVVGKTGSGKSSLGNTLFGEKWFNPDHSSSSGTTTCESATKEVMNKQLTLIDTPGLFDTGRPEEELKSEIIRSIVECSPGAHAFLIVFKVETYSELEKMVITRICDYFSEDMLKYSVIVFTHGDQLSEGTTIQKFVNQNQKLKDVVRKCDDRCHVFDSKYWKNNNPEEEYRSNSYQLKELLNTVEKLVRNNKGNIYTNEMLQKVEQMIQKNKKLIRQTESELSDEKVDEKAKDKTTEYLLKVLAGVGAGALLGAFVGAVAVAVVGAVAVASAGAGAGAVAGAVAVAGAGTGAVAVAGAGTVTIAAAAAGVGAVAGVGAAIGGITAAIVSKTRKSS